MANQSEYRVSAKDKIGRPVVKIFNATSKKEAKQKATVWLNRSQATLVRVDMKRTYVFKARKGDRQIAGSQQAYSRAEVKSALEKIGYEVTSVYSPFQYKTAAPAPEIVSFVTQSARLLEQKLPFNEVLNLMLSTTKDKTLNQALRDIIGELRNGVDSRDAFMRQSTVFGKHTAMLLGIATKSGDVAGVFKSIAVLVERTAEFSKGLRSALMMPAVTMLTLVGAIVFYAVVLVPQTVELLGPMLKEIPPLTAMTLDVSAFIKNNYILILLGTAGSLAGFYAYLGTPKGHLAYHRVMVRLPFIGDVLRNSSTEIFARILGIIYTSSGENIEAIQIAAEASGNDWFSRQIKTVAIPMMLSRGVELARALEATGFLPEIALARFKTATETGSVKATAQQLADYYETDNKYAMKNLMNIVELSVTVVIMLSLVFLTVLSSETASLKLN